jgi:hypothetical protein
VLAVVLAAMCPFATACCAGTIALALRPSTLFNGRWGAALIIAVSAAVLTYVFAGFTLGSIRAARAPQGAVTLYLDGILVEDTGVFDAPLWLPREFVTVAPAPSERMAFAALSPASRERAALVSMVPDRPNVLVRFQTKSRLPNARRWNSVPARFVHLPQAPDPDVPYGGIWLRAATPEGRDTILRWGGQPVGPGTTSDPGTERARHDGRL